MDAKGLASIVSKSAPVLGAALGGIGAPVGLIIGGIASLFGDSGNDLSELSKKIISDPEASLKLLQYQEQHQEELLKISVSNLDSARHREESIVASTQKRDWLMDFIAVFICGAFLLLCIMVGFVPLQAQTHDTFYLLIGAFAGGFGCIINYYFGSSMQQIQLPKRVNQQEQIVLPPPAQKLIQ